MRIKDLKVGDAVIVNRRKVSRVVGRTRNALIVEGCEHLRFSLVTGWAFGMGPENMSCIEPATDKAVKMIEEDDRRGALLSLGVNRLRSISRLDRLAEIVGGITE